MARKLVIANNPLLSGPAMQDRERTGIPYREIQVSQIDADPNQPRTSFDPERLEELAHSIRTYGVLSPLLVRSGPGVGRYTLIAGERRLRAAQKIGLKNVPVLIDREGHSSGDRTLSMQLVENLQRADLSPLERAHAIGALRDAHSLSVRDIADKLGISKSMVQRSLEILQLPDDLLKALKDGAAESKVLLLSKIEDPEIRASYLKEIDVLTRSQLEKDLEKGDRSKHAERVELSPDDDRIRGEMEKALGLKVRMIKSDSSSETGRIVIEFYSVGDLQEIHRRLVSTPDFENFG